VSNCYRVGLFELDARRRTLVTAGEQVTLGARAFDLLLCLIEHRDRVVTKDELLELVWPGLVVEENNLTVQVSAVRKILGAEAVVTVSGRGYRLAIEVTEVDTETANAQSSAPSLPPVFAMAATLALPDKPSLAVLPFTNMSGDATQDYFVDGVVDDIIGALSRVRAFFVIARTSSFTYKGRTVDIKQVGRELGVRYIVEGSFRKAGDRVRIAGELIEAETGRYIWTDRFEGSLNDIFELQDRITESVVGAIEPTLRLAEVERARAKPTTNLGAYDLCLRAQPDMFSISTKAANDEAIALLYRAIEMDPDYSYAKAACAAAYMFRKAQMWISDAEIAEGMRLARVALANHRDEPDTLTYAAHALAYLGFEHDEALRAIDRALALNPNSTRTLDSAGWIRVYAGDGAAAAVHFQRALRLNPRDPALGLLLSGLGLAFLVDGKYAQALEIGLKALQESRIWISAHLLITISLVQLGRIDEAKLAAQRMLKLAPGLTLALRRKQMPIRDQAYRERVINALRIAGVPE